MFGSKGKRERGWQRVVSGWVGQGCLAETASEHPPIGFPRYGRWLLFVLCRVSDVTRGYREAALVIVAIIDPPVCSPFALFFLASDSLHRPKTMLHRTFNDSSSLRILNASWKLEAVNTDRSSLLDTFSMFRHISNNSAIN